MKPFLCLLIQICHLFLLNKRTIETVIYKATDKFPCNQETVESDSVLFQKGRREGNNVPSVLSARPRSPQSSIILSSDVDATNDSAAIALHHQPLQESQISLKEFGRSSNSTKRLQSSQISILDQVLARRRRRRLACLNGNPFDHEFKRGMHNTNAYSPANYLLREVRLQLLENFGCERAAGFEYTTEAIQALNETAKRMRDVGDDDF